MFTSPFERDRDGCEGRLWGPRGVLRVRARPQGEGGASSSLCEQPARGLAIWMSKWNSARDGTDHAAPPLSSGRAEDMSEDSAPLLAPLSGEATTFLPTHQEAPTPKEEIQIDPRLCSSFFYVREVFSQTQEESLKKILHSNN